MLTVFWDYTSISQHEFVLKGVKINCETYMKILMKLNNESITFIMKKCRCFSNMITPDPILVQPLGNVENIGLEVLPHSSYSPELAPCVFSLFAALSKQPNRIHVVCDEVQAAIGKCNRGQPEEFYNKGFEEFVRCWWRCIG
jgi:hypothetical protein